MSLNNIELTDPMIALIYSNCLIDCNSAKSEEPGKTTRKILVIATSGDKSSPDHDILISGMMKACKILPEGYEVKELESDLITDLNKKDREFVPAGILVFGEMNEISESGIKTRHHEVSELNGIPLLTAPSLEKISSDKKIKMEVWESLKNFFGI